MIDPLQRIRRALENTNRLMRDRRCGSHDPAAGQPCEVCDMIEGNEQALAVLPDLVQAIMLASESEPNKRRDPVVDYSNKEWWDAKRAEVDEAISNGPELIPDVGDGNYIQNNRTARALQFWMFQKIVPDDVIGCLVNALSVINGLRQSLWIQKTGKPHANSKAWKILYDCVDGISQSALGGLEPSAAYCISKCENAIEGYSRAVVAEPASPIPANKAPYDTLGLFLTKEGHWVEGFIYDGDEKDYGHVAYLPLPPIPEWAELDQSDDDGECMYVKTWGMP
jgi:hypothetical protein